MRTAPVTILLVLAAVTAAGCRDDLLRPVNSAIAAIQVTVSTTGPDVDADGYDLVLDGNFRKAISVNGTVTLSVAAGTHSVTLAGIADNCVLAGSNSRSVTVARNDTALIAFVADCVAYGTLRVTAATTGIDPDPDGYAVRLTDAEYYWRPAFDDVVPTNGSVTLLQLTRRDYVVRLRDVAVNCEVRDDAARTVNVPSGDTVAVVFEVACTPVTRLLYTRGEVPDIYVINSNGTGATRLTAVGADPAWSPDERTVAFTGTLNGTRGIHVMQADGSSLRRLTSGAASEYQPTWSPDGTRIAFVSERHGSPELYVMNADGTGQVRLTDNAANDMQPAWSPDGSRIAFTSDRSGTPWIHVMNADGSAVARLGDQAAPDENPAWSPDGARLAFTRQVCSVSSSCSPQLFLMNVNGSGAAPIGDSGIQPTWSPDGRRLAYTAVVCDDYYYYEHGCHAAGIRIVNLADGEVIDLTTVASDSQPAWRR